ncbi:uncharacterized protein CBL_10827 [Carabus blaptoides fortunei]
MKPNLEIWKKEISFKNFGFNHNNYLDFYKSQWQRTNICLNYVIYRIAIALTFFTAFVLSIIDLDNIYKSAALRAKWLIYLTNWHYTVCTLQSVLSACMVTRMYRQVRQNGEYMQMTFVNHTMCNVFWALNTIAVNGAVFVSLVYWTMVFDPRIDSLSVINIFTHAINAVILLVDYFIVAHPIRLLHFYIPCCFNLIYVAFSIMYYLLSGTDKHDRHFIYAILDWKTPQSTIKNLLFTVFLVLVLHIFLYFYILLRMFIAKNRFKSTDQAICPLQGRSEDV